MTEERVANSCYRVREGRLVPLRPESDEPDRLALLVHSQFLGMILSPAFPCLGGAGAIRRGDYRFAIYGELGSADAIRSCARDLTRFMRDSPADHNPVAAFVAAFHGRVLPTEVAFEAALWEQLRGLHELDAHRGAGDSRRGGSHGAGPDVDDDDPGFVFGDRDFFVVGLHPASSRWARRFGWPTLVFNALTHSEELRRAGKYERMQERILTRDRRLQGTDNPSLPYSQISQFSGRRVDSGWQPPIEFD